MPVVAAYLYRGGERAEPLSLGRTPAVLNDRSEFAWIGLFEPSWEELKIVADQYGLHPLAVEDCVKSHALPKIQVYGDQLFVVARTAHLDHDRITYGETSILVGQNHIITVRHGSARTHIHLRQHLEAAPGRLKHGVDYVLHAILEFIVDGYLPIVEAIEESVLEMEQMTSEMFLSPDEIQRIFGLRRELTRFQRMLGPISEVTNKFVNLDLPCVDPVVRPYFRDVLDHVRRVEVRAAGLKDVLTSVFEVSSLLEQQRQGRITRQLAAWAAILAVPTAIAGIYGMNFENMPELKTQNGYFIVLGVIGLICAALYTRFRRSAWL